MTAVGDAPYPPILGMAAAQLKVPTGAWNFYAEREETRREHLGRGHLVRNPGRPAGGHQNYRNQPSSLRPVQTTAQRTLVAWGGSPPWVASNKFMNFVEVLEILFSSR